MSYSFSLNRDKKFTCGPYWDHTSLKMIGKLLNPEKLANRTIQIDIMGKHDLVPVMESPEKYEYEPRCVGILTIRGKQTEFLAWIPFDALQSICLLLQAGKIKILVLSGQSLYRGSADITSIYLEREYNPDDWM